MKAEPSEDTASPLIPTLSQRGRGISFRFGALLKDKGPIVVALCLGLAAGLLAYVAIRKKGSDARQGWNLVEVVAARQDLAEGALVTREMMETRPIPEQFVTSSIVQPDLASYIENQRLLVPLQRGDPFLWTQFETTKTGDHLSTKVARRARAITIDASKKTSIGGWLRPNDHVDVIGTFKDPNGNEQIAVTILQNVIVLATGKITGTTNLNLLSESQREYSTVSLLVLPEEAEILTLATELGGLTLALRNEEDLDLVEERGRTTIHTLLSGERAKNLQARRQQTVEIIRGGMGRPR